MKRDDVTDRDAVEDWHALLRMAFDMPHTPLGFEWIVERVERQAQEGRT
ncbi:MAG: hypothetical protein AAGA28_08980 [Pseudomonadota bacterium]